MVRSSEMVREAVRACRKERVEGFGQMYECLTEKVADARAARDVPNAAKFPTSLQADINQATRRFVGASARARKIKGRR